MFFCICMSNRVVVLECGGTYYVYRELVGKINFLGYEQWLKCNKINVYKEQTFNEHAVVRHKKHAILCVSNIDYAKCLIYGKIWYSHTHTHKSTLHEHGTFFPFLCLLKGNINLFYSFLNFIHFLMSLMTLTFVCTKIKQLIFDSLGKLYFLVFKFFDYKVANIWINLKNEQGFYLFIPKALQLIKTRKIKTNHFSK